MGTVLPFPTRPAAAVSNPYVSPGAAIRPAAQASQPSTTVVVLLIGGVIAAVAAKEWLSWASMQESQKYRNRRR